MKFCSQCGSGQIALQTPEGDNRLRYVCPDCQTIHYQNPKIIVGCLPIYQNQVLLCKRAIEPRAGYWNFPAGFMENDETVEQGAMRETWEEAGAKVEIIRLHTIYNILHINQVYLVFLAKLQSPEWQIGPETLEARLFDESDIPWQDLAFPSNYFTLKRFFANRQYEGVHISAFQKT